MPREFGGPTGFESFSDENKEPEGMDRNITRNIEQRNKEQYGEKERKKTLSQYILKWWRGDAHTHSKESTREDYGYAEGVYGIKEILDYYKKIGLEFACFAEHASKPGAPSKQSAESPVCQSLLKEAREIAEINKERGGDIAGLSSVEANIMFDENGEPILDIPEEVLQKLDIVIASRHAIADEKEPRAIKKSLIAAINNKSIDVIGHPDRYARKDGDQPQEYWDEYYGAWEEIAEEMARQGKAFEINLNNPPDEKLLEIAIEAGLKFFINFDAHDFGQYKKDEAEIIKKGEAAKNRWAKGEMAADDEEILDQYKDYRLSEGPGVRPILKLVRIIKKLEKAGVTPGKVINSSRDRLLEFLTEERGKSTENLEYLKSL